VLDEITYIVQSALRCSPIYKIDMKCWGAQSCSKFLCIQADDDSITGVWVVRKSGVVQDMEMCLRKCF